MNIDAAMKNNYLLWFWHEISVIEIGNKQWCTYKKDFVFSELTLNVQAIIEMNINAINWNNWLVFESNTIQANSISTI